MDCRDDGAPEAIVPVAGPAELANVSRQTVQRVRKEVVLDVCCLGKDRRVGAVIHTS